MTATIPSQRIQLLASMPATRSDLTRITGIASRTVYTLVERMLENGECYISTEIYGYRNARLPVFDVCPGVPKDTPVRIKEKLPKPDLLKKDNIDLLRSKQRMGKYVDVILSEQPQQWWSALEIAA